jgi:DNA-binding CsgD family transcriptional regulator
VASHIYFIYYILSLGVGAGGVAFAWLRWLRLKDGLDRDYFMVVLSILITITCMTVSANLPVAGYAAWHEALNLTSLLALATATIFQAAFVVRLSGVPPSALRLIVRIFVPVMLVVAASIPGLHWTRFATAPVLTLFGLFSFTTLAFLTIAIIAPGRRSSEEPACASLTFWRHHARILAVMMLLFIPLIVLFDLFALPLGGASATEMPKFTPLMFLIWSLLFIVWELGEPQGSPIAHGAAGSDSVVGLRESGQSSASESERIVVWDRYGLSQREREVADLLISGLSYRQIADRLFVSPGTVKTHVLSVYRKTRTNTKIQLLSLAYPGRSSKAPTRESPH